MITIILLLQMNTCLSIRLTVGLRHYFNIGLHLCQQFLFRDTANATVIIRHADILQIIQFAENAHLAKLADTCQEKEAEIFSTLLQRAEKVAHNASDFFLQFR